MKSDEKADTNEKVYANTAAKADETEAKNCGRNMIPNISPNINPRDLMLYAITQSPGLNGKALVHQVEEALKGGVTCIQLREKIITQGFMGEALEIKALCNKYKVPFIINDLVDLAISLDADGVHLGKEDMDIKTAREKLGPTKIIGATARTPQDAVMAQEQGADYIGAGAVFPCVTKTNTIPLDKSILAEICKSVKIPVVAIGGITRENILELKGAGISGVAVVSAIFGAPSITAATKELLMATGDLVAER